MVPVLHFKISTLKIKDTVSQLRALLFFGHITLYPSNKSFHLSDRPAHYKSRICSVYSLYPVRWLPSDIMIVPVTLRPPHCTTFIFFPDTINQVESLFRGTDMASGIPGNPPPVPTSMISELREGIPELLLFPGNASTCLKIQFVNVLYCDTTLIFRFQSWYRVLQLQQS